MEVRSYRRVFDLERRIYRVDRVRLNPGGVPVRGVVYCLAILAAALVARRLPLAGTAARMVPWYVGDLALPLASAAILTMIRIEGRPFHLAAAALVRYRTGPRRLAGARRCPARGERWHPQEIVLLPDGSDSLLRRLRYTGPGAVLVAVEHECAEQGWPRPRIGRRRPTVTLRARTGAAGVLHREIVALAPGAQLLVRPQSGSKG
jgi:hypothetical protein